MIKRGFTPEHRTPRLLLYIVAPEAFPAQETQRYQLLNFAKQTFTISIKGI